MLEKAGDLLTNEAAIVLDATRDKTYTLICEAVRDLNEGKSAT